MIKIAHARSSEHKTKYGTAGDQTGREVSISNYYPGKNLSIYRAKKETKREIIALTMEAACKNDLIGYSQGKERYTLWEEAEPVNFNPSKVKKKCNCDCSSLVAVAINAAGIHVPKTISTATMEKAIERTGEFQIIKGDVTLQRGDIVRRTGHTFVVVQAEREEKEEVDFAHEFDGSLKGTYKTKGRTNLRRGAGLGKKILQTVPGGTLLKNYGYFSIDARGVKWLFCLYGKESIFVSERTVEKI